MNIIKNFYFYLGLIAPFPLFIIPYYPFIYINLITKDESWIINSIPPYTGYTGSLGLAAPIIILSVSILFSAIFISQIKHFLYNKMFLLCIALLMLFVMSMGILTSSIKTLGPIASFLCFLMVTYIFQSNYSKYFSSGYVTGFSIFLILHGFSLAFYGLDFAINSEGISIFNIEIYQALVSYSSTASFFLCAVIMNKELIKQIPLISNHKYLYRIIYLLLITSIIFILLVTSRRLSILICGLGMFLYLTSLLKNDGLSKNFIPISFFASFFVIFYFLKDFIFVGAKSINFSNMIQPRLDAYMDKLSFIYDSTLLEIIFGPENDWALIENGILDIILNTGIFGLAVFIITFLCLLLNHFQTCFGNVEWNKSNKIFMIFSFLILLFNNIVNNGISTPYFFISIIIITTICIKPWNAGNETY